MSYHAALPPWLLKAVEQAGDATVILKPGDRPYVIRSKAPYHLGTQPLTNLAIEGLAQQILSEEAQQALYEGLPVEETLSGDRLPVTVNAARLERDVVLRLRRTPVVDEIALALEEETRIIKARVAAAPATASAGQSSPDAPVADAASTASPSPSPSPRDFVVQNAGGDVVAEIDLPTDEQELDTFIARIAARQADAAASAKTAENIPAPATVPNALPDADDLTVLLRPHEVEAARRAAEEAAQRKQEEAARRAAEEAAQREQEEAARRADEEAARREQEEAARRADEEAARREQEEAARRAAEEAAKREEEEAARRAAEEAARLAREEAARREQEEDERRPADSRSWIPWRKRRKEEDEPARLAAEEAAKREAEEAARRAAEDAAKREQEKAARRAAEEAVKLEAEEAARRAAEEAAKREAEAEEAARRAAEEAAKREEEEAARRAAEEAAKREEEEAARRAAEEAAKREAEEAARRAAEEAAKREEEEAARRAAEEAARRAAEEAAKREAEEAARRAAEEAAKREEEEAARRAAEEAAKREEEEAARRAAEEAAKREEEEAARRAAEEAAQREQEEAARRAAEQAAQREREEAARRASDVAARRQQEEAARRAAEEAARRPSEDAAPARLERDEEAEISEAERLPARATVVEMRRRPLPVATAELIDWILEAINQGASALYLRADKAPSARIDGRVEALASDPLPMSMFERAGTTMMGGQDGWRPAGNWAWTKDIPAAGNVHCQAFSDGRGGGFIVQLPVSLAGLEQQVPRHIRNACETGDGLIVVGAPFMEDVAAMVGAVVASTAERRPGFIVAFGAGAPLQSAAINAFVSERPLPSTDYEMTGEIQNALRERPDVLVVTAHESVPAPEAIISAAVGRLVIVGVVARTAPRAIEVLMKSGGLNRRAFATVFKGACSWRIFHRTGGRRTVVADSLLPNDHVRALIDAGDIAGLHATQNNREDGMRALDAALAAAVTRRKITLREAAAGAVDRRVMIALVRRLAREARAAQREEQRATHRAPVRSMNGA